MPWDLSGLQFKEMVIHEIPSANTGAGTAEPVLSDAPSPLTDDLRIFFTTKIRQIARSENSFSARFRAVTASPVPGLMRDYMSSTTQLVPMSQACAQHLAATQDRRTSTGLLAIATGTFSQQPVIIIMKLEHDEGVRVRRSAGQDGHQTLELEHIRELMMTQNTKFFKQAIIQPTGSGEFRLEVSDSQRSRTSGSPIAAFFLTEFLGAETIVDPREATKRFASGVTTFINEHVSSPDDQVSLSVQLVSYLESNQSTLNVKTFGVQSVPPTMQDAFVEHMKDAGVPSGNFRKQTDLVSNTLKELRLTGKHGMVIFGPPKQFKDRVSLEADHDGQTRATVVDVFNKIKP